MWVRRCNYHEARDELRDGSSEKAKFVETDCRGDGGGCPGVAAVRLPVDV